MALLAALKFSQEEMPKVYDPAGITGLKVEDFVVASREGSEDIAFIAAIEHKSVQQLKLRPEPYPRIIRKATQQEIDAWWERKLQERRAFVLAKEKARDLQLDIKIARIRIDPRDNKAIFHFTSDQRVDFRALVRELSIHLKLRIELWQIGVRDEARMVDGFGVCGLQTCCSTWLKEFRPISIRMAKDQDINLPPGKLSGQCGRLLCCLSYEVDQYRQLSREALSKGSTVEHEGKRMVIVDRNLVAATYLLADEAGVTKSVKAADLGSAKPRVPEQMKKAGKEIASRIRHEEAVEDIQAAEQLQDEETRAVLFTESRILERTPPPLTKTPAEETPADRPSARPADEKEGRKGRQKKRRRGQGRNREGRDERPAEAQQPQQQQSRPPREKQRREPPPPKGEQAAEGGEKQPGRRHGRRRRKRRED